MKERNYWRGTHGYDRAAVTGGLIHNSIITETLHLRPSSALPQKGVWMNCEFWHKKTLCFYLWLSSESCQCEDLNFCLFFRPWRKNIKFFCCCRWIWYIVTTYYLSSNLFKGNSTTTLMCIYSTMDFIFKLKYQFQYHLKEYLFIYLLAIIWSDWSHWDQRSLLQGWLEPPKATYTQTTTHSHSFIHICFLFRTGLLAAAISHLTCQQKNSQCNFEIFDIYLMQQLYIALQWWN